jgi:hypothetical protein
MRKRNRTDSLHHRWRTGWRETLILLGEFRRPVFIFTIAVLGLGILYHYLARQAGEPLNHLLHDNE